MQALYTDGTPVNEGDRVRYHQTPGGLMAPATNSDGTIKWHTGTAVKLPWYQGAENAEKRASAIRAGIDPDELTCEYDTPSVWGGGYGHMACHIIERWDA